MDATKSEYSTSQYQSTSGDVPRGDSKDMLKVKKEEEKRAKRIEKKKQDLKKKAKKDESKEQEEEMDSSFDKNLFLYHRCYNYPCLGQIEVKCKLKLSAWNDRYVVMYCNYLVFYETKSGQKPREHDRPLGGIPLEDVQYKRVRMFEEKMELSGLIPRKVYYEDCLECPFVTNKTERMALLQFEDQTTATQWLDAVRSRAKNIEAVKGKVDYTEIRITVEGLMLSHPINTHLKETPYPGEEDHWIDVLTDYWLTRNKKRPILRRAQLFATSFTPNYCPYINWFVTSGSEAGVQSLERDLIACEDTIVAGWQIEFSEDPSPTEKAAQSLDPNDELGHIELLKRVQRKLNCIMFFKKFYGLVYPNKVLENLDDYQKRWQYFTVMIQGRIDKVVNEREGQANAELQIRKEEAMKLAEDDLFADTSTPDDMFSDIKVMTI